MKTFEDYKAALEAAGPRLREKLLVQADEDGFTAWELAELAGIQAEPYAKKRSIRRQFT